MIIIEHLLDGLHFIKLRAKQYGIYFVDSKTNKDYNKKGTDDDLFLGLVYL